MLSKTHGLDEMYAKDRESIQNLIDQIKASGKKNTFAFKALLDANNEQILEWKKVNQKRSSQIFDGISDRDLGIYIEFLKNPGINGKTYAEDQGAIEEYTRRIEAKGLHTSFTSASSSGSVTSNNDVRLQQSVKKKHKKPQKEKTPQVLQAPPAVIAQPNVITNTSSTAMATWSVVDFCSPKVVGALILMSALAMKLAMDYLNRAAPEQNLQR